MVSFTLVLRPSVLTVQPVSGVPVFPKKGLYSRQAPFHFHFYPQQVLDVRLLAASRVQGVLGMRGLKVTYDARQLHFACSE